MGCPERYYKEALKKFAHSLWFDSNKKKARQLADEESIKELEDAIRIQKENTNVIDFVFDAGISAGMVLESADRDGGCDGFNACLGGLSDFEDFIKGL